MGVELAANSVELKKKFFELSSPQDVAALLEIKYSHLEYHLDLIPIDKKYRTFYLPKKSGGNRTITAPISALRIIQRKLNQVLQLVYAPEASTHGFVMSRNIVTNAQMHIEPSKKWILNIDLKDFFPSIHFEQVQQIFMMAPYNLREAVAVILAKICCFNNSLPQGAPTSPIISNMICVNLDNELNQLAHNCRCIYTRYADDITFSASTAVNFPKDLFLLDDSNKVQIGEKLESIVRKNGFEINLNKVRLQVSSQRQEVTGLIVNGNKPNVKRSFIRQVRAMLHASKKYGLDAAEKEHLEFYTTKQVYPGGQSPSFEKVIRGKIEFIGMVRGKNDTLYVKLLRQLENLKQITQEVVQSESSEPVSVPLESEIVSDRLEQIPAIYRLALHSFPDEQGLEKKQAFVVYHHDDSNEYSFNSKFPFTKDELTAILKGLPFENSKEAQLTESQSKILIELGFLDKSRPVFFPDWREKIGLALFDALFPEEIGEDVKHYLRVLYQSHTKLDILISFNSGAVELSRYPWELIKTKSFEQPLIGSGAVNLVRKISRGKDRQSQFNIDDLDILYIESRPSNLPELPIGDEQNAISKAFDHLTKESVVSISKLQPATYTSLINHVNHNSKNTIIHFDGHGTVSRLCPSCQKMIYPHYSICPTPDCNFPLDEVDPRGYLAFESEVPDRNVDWIDSKQLGLLLANSNFRLAVISACRSGEIRGKSLFGSIAPSLIDAGVPAVVSMQMPITVDAAVNFMQEFYGALAKSESVPSAIQMGRVKLLRSREWFIPVIYWQGNKIGEPFLRKRSRK